MFNEAAAENQNKQNGIQNVRHIEAMIPDTMQRVPTRDLPTISTSESPYQKQGSPAAAERQITNSNRLPEKRKIIEDAMEDTVSPWFYVKPTKNPSLPAIAKPGSDRSISLGFESEEQFEETGSLSSESLSSYPSAKNVGAVMSDSVKEKRPRFSDSPNRPVLNKNLNMSHQNDKDRHFRLKNRGWESWIHRRKSDMHSASTMSKQVNSNESKTVNLKPVEKHTTSPPGNYTLRKKTAKKYDDTSSESDESSSKGELHVFKKQIDDSDELSSEPSELHQHVPLEVEKIVDKDFDGERVSYRVRWLGFGPHRDDWKFENDLKSCWDLVVEFENSRVWHNHPDRKVMYLLALQCEFY